MSTLTESVHRQKCVCGHSPEDHRFFPDDPADGLGHCWELVPAGTVSADGSRNCPCRRYRKHDCHGGVPGEVNPL